MRILICFLLFYSSLFCQDKVLTNFQVELVNDNVFIYWKLKTGNTCNGIDILRSIDSVNFEKIYQIDGVCGSNFEDKYYDYTDKKPIKNQLSYYQLDLKDLGKSQKLSIFVIDFKEKQYHILNNPIASESLVYFQNKDNFLLNFKVYNLQGLCVKNIQTQENFVKLISNDYKAGKYYFEIISNANESIKGSFIVP